MSHYSSSQDVEEFEQNLAANMRFLREHLEEVSQRDFNFAKSLCDYYDIYDKLSTKQMVYAAKFFAEIKSATEEEPEYSRGVAGVRNDSVSNNSSTSKHPGESAPRVVVDGTELLNRFNMASEKLKFPKIHYWMEDGRELTFYRTGLRSKNPGSIGVVIPEGWKSQLYLGLILNKKTDPNHGKLLWARDAWGKAELQQLIKRIVDSFPQELAINGKKKGSCCFCGLSLENKNSLAVGYGPICAGNYGLPWGEPEQHELGVTL
jgi:hypothetical protein